MIRKLRRIKSLRCTLIAVLMALTSSVALGQNNACGWDEPAPATVQATYVTGDFAIDGHLDEPAWARATPATGFTQYEPDPGAPASQDSEAYVLYTDEALYIGARLYDNEPEAIVGRLARRNQDVYSDWFYVSLDSYNDNRTAFSFGVNARGVQRDLLIYDDTATDDSWEAVWQAATQVDSTAWTVEMRIPFSQLRFSSSDVARLEMSWGINFRRHVARLNETQTWSAMRPDGGRRVSCFGRLAGLRNVNPPSNLEILPYAVSRLTRAPGDDANPFYSPNALFGSFGADLQYQLTSDLTLNATLNPDFGQVEADPAQVNLSAFETFFSERRPFFTEGADIFRFRITPDQGSGEQLFYSRRIGQTPSYTPHVDGGYVDMPEATRILGASKVSGQSGPWSIGALNAVTENATARISRSDGSRETIAVEPVTNYAVGRVQRNFGGGRSSLGGILTTTNRFITDDHLAFLPAGAFAGGIDFRHRFADNAYELSGFLLGSHVTGSEAAITRLQRSPARYYQRPDADHVTFDPSRTSLSGYSAAFNLQRISGTWRWGFLSLLRSPGFEVNDLGFQQNADMAFAAGYLLYTAYQPLPLLRRISAEVNVVPGVNLAGEPIQIGSNFNMNLEFSNQWRAWLGSWHERPSVNVNQLRGGPAIHNPGQTNFWAGFGTDRRRAVVGNVEGNASFRHQTGGRSVNMSPSVTLRPAPHIELSLQPRLAFNDNPWQYVQTVDHNGQTRYIFGHISQTEASLTTRLSYTFSPTLSIEFYAQPFISAGAYNDFREVTDPRAPRFEDRSRLFGHDELIAGEEQYGVDLTGNETPDFHFRNPDFNIRELNTNAVLRWEYRPGSTFYVVWQQQRSGFLPNGRFDLSRDVDGLFSTPATNVLMVKLNYWFDL